MSEGYPRAARITRRSDFQRLVTEGKRVRTADLGVRYLESPLGHLRVGIIVPLHGHTAVERNMLKRRMRELIRRLLLPESVSKDVVIRCQPSAYGKTFRELAQAVESVRSGLLAAAAGRDLG